MCGGLYRVYIIIIIINIRGSRIDVRAKLAYLRSHIVPLSCATKPRARIEWAKMLAAVLFNSAVEQLIIQFYLFVCVHNAIFVFFFFFYSFVEIFFLVCIFDMGHAIVSFVGRSLCSARTLLDDRPIEEQTVWNCKYLRSFYLHSEFHIKWFICVRFESVQSEEFTQCNGKNVVCRERAKELFGSRAHGNGKSLVELPDMTRPMAGSEGSIRTQGSSRNQLCKHSVDDSSFYSVSPL